MDRITLSGIAVFAHHGIYEDEQRDGQMFSIDVAIAMDLSAAAASDDLAATVDYARLTRAIQERVAGERWNLIETVAVRVADLILEDRRVEHVEVTVHKPEAPMPGPVDDVAVTVSRGR